MKIADIRRNMQKYNLDACVITHGNRFIGQDILPTEHVLQKLCGFSGSAGLLLVTADKAYLLVDGRYELQAKKETDADEITVVNAMPRLKNACDLLSDVDSCEVGYNSWCHTVAEMEYIKRKYQKISFCGVNWLEEEKRGKVKVYERELKYAGLAADEKLQKITDILKQENADYYLFTAADSVSWLLNIYAHELPYTPIVRAYALVNREGDAVLIADNLETKLTTWSWQKFIDMTSQISGKKFLYDAHTTPEKIKNMLEINNYPYKYRDMCQQYKAEKNDSELQGMIDCHISDGVALCKFLCWLEKKWQGLTEIDVACHLHEWRSQSKLFISESFATIAGSGANAAIVHYQPSEIHSAKLTANTLLLIDSGGQYLNGTTDVTRTIVIGKPTAEMIHDFTLVLRSHIALAMACFPENTSGTKLDIIARLPLWQNGLDYKHGTGHGVACFGNVHEGPISISANGSEYGIKSNMVTSIEPGIYKENKYGIRIENLFYTAKAENISSDVNFLQFKHLTKVPIDKRLIDKYMLSDGERAWLNEYHKNVYESLAPYMSATEKAWLQEACSPL